VQARFAQQQSPGISRPPWAQYQARQKQCHTLDNQAHRRRGAGARAAGPRRQQQAQLLATQRAHYAKSGVVNEGSPLAVLATGPRRTEPGRPDVAYQSDLESRQWQQKAGLTSGSRAASA